MRAVFRQECSPCRAENPDVVKAYLYMINSIPQNFLPDPQGCIIDMNLRGEALEKALEKILH